MVTGAAGAGVIFYSENMLRCVPIFAPSLALSNGIVFAGWLDAAASAAAPGDAWPTFGRRRAGNLACRAAFEISSGSDAKPRFCRSCSISTFLVCLRSRAAASRHAFRIDMSAK